MGLLSQVKFEPADSVLFKPEKAVQQTQLTIDNATEVAVMFKMKSTRPGLYKMRPVFGLVQAGDKSQVKLIFKGLKGPVSKCPTSDHFTCVMALAPSTTTKVEKMWKQHKFHARMVDQELRKKSIHIKFEGINDHINNEPENQEEEKDKQFKVKKDKGLIDEDGKEAAAAAPAGPAGIGKPVVLMFRPRQEEPDSLSGEEEEEGENKTKEQTKDQTLSRASEKPDNFANEQATQVPQTENPEQPPGDNVSTSKCVTAPMTQAFKNPNQYKLGGAPGGDCKTAAPTSMVGNPTECKTQAGGVSMIGGAGEIKSGGGAKGGASKMGAPGPECKTQAMSVMGGATVPVIPAELIKPANQYKLNKDDNTKTASMVPNMKQNQYKLPANKAPAVKVNSKSSISKVKK